MKLGVEPANLCELPYGVDWASVVPVDQADRVVVDGEDVPRAEIAMANDRMTSREAPGKPRRPDGIGTRLEGGRCFVQSAQELTNDEGGLGCPRSRLWTFAFEEREPFSTIWRKATIDRSRSGVEALGMHMIEQPDDRGALRSG